MHDDHIKPLLPHDTVFLSTDTGMYIRRNERVLLLKSKTIHAAFARLAPLLDGQHALGALCAVLPDAGASALRHLLLSLIDKKMLIARSDADQALLTAEERACYASQLAFLEHLVEQPGAALHRLRNARVYLDGDGMACQAAGKTLLRNGVGRLYLAAGLDDEVAAVLQETAGALRGQGVGVAVQRLHDNFTIEHARHGFSYATYVSDRPTFDLLTELTRLCAIDGTPLFPAVLIDGAARIGPLPAPHGPGCWHCAFLRLLDQLPAPLAAHLWRHRALGLPYLDEQQYSGAPLLQIMGNGVAFRLFQHVCGIAGTVLNRGHMVESISSLTLEARTGTVLPHPDCVLSGHARVAAAPTDDALAAANMLVATDFGLFMGFDDDTLKQVPVFQSRVWRSGLAAGRTSYPGNSLVSNAQARRQALLAAALDYAAQHAPASGAQLSSAQAARRQWNIIDAAAVVGTVGLADPARHVTAWLTATGAVDGRQYLLPETGLAGAGVAGGAGFGFEEAGTAATQMLLARQGLLAVVDGALIPVAADPALWTSENAAWFALLRATAPASTAWTFTVAGTTVAIIALDPDGATVLIGAGTSVDAALRAALTEAMAIGAGGATTWAWSDFLPPALGYAPFDAPGADTRGPSHMALAALGGGAAEVVYCDITPGDLAQAGIVVVKAALVRQASMAATSNETNEVAA